jgi:hypothetical protein
MVVHTATLLPAAAHCKPFRTEQQLISQVLAVLAPVVGVVAVADQAGAVDLDVVDPDVVVAALVLDVAGIHTVVVVVAAAAAVDRKNPSS